MADKASNSDPVYFYLVKLTPLGRVQSDEDIEKAIDELKEALRRNS